MSISIANGALDRIGVSPIRSLSDGNNGDIVSRHLPRAAELVLRDVLWSEETVNVCPPQLAVCDDCALPCDFPYAFALPKDFVRAYRVRPHSNSSQDCDDKCDCDCCKPREWKNKPKSAERKERSQRAVTPIESDGIDFRVMRVMAKRGKCRAVLAPCASIQLEYVCLPNDLDTLPVDICEAVEIKLAERLVTPLKQSRALKDDLKKEYMDFIAEAEMTSAAQDQEQLWQGEGEIVASRLSLSGW